MKLSRIILCAVLFVAASALGQTRAGDVVVDVPFAFTVAGQALPAGHYIVAAGGTDVIRIFNSQNQGLFVPTHDAQRATSDGTKLVFHRYGDTYFLSAVWVAGNPTGRELASSRAERELANRRTEMELAVVRPAK